MRKAHRPVLPHSFPWWHLVAKPLVEEMRMSYENIEVASTDGIARIALNRPERLNSFTRAMHAELRDALANLGDARVVVLTGAGRGFCAGQDLNDRAVAPGEAVDLGETVEDSWNPLIRRLATMPQPVIASVNGGAPR